MELIDRLKTIKALDEAKIKTTSEEYDRIIDVIGSMPTIEEHKTGRWSVNEVGVVRCPFCHANMNPRKNRKPKYCDECGARLEGAEE